MFPEHFSLLARFGESSCRAAGCSHIRRGDCMSAWPCVTTYRPSGGIASQKCCRAALLDLSCLPIFARSICAYIAKSRLTVSKTNRNTQYKRAKSQLKALENIGLHALQMTERNRRGLAKEQRMLCSPRTTTNHCMLPRRNHSATAMTAAGGRRNGGRLRGRLKFSRGNSVS